MNVDGSKIDRLRQERGLSLEDLAVAAKVDKKTVVKIVTGKTRSPHPHTVACLASALRVAPAELGDGPTPAPIHPSIAAYLVVRDSDREVVGVQPLGPEDITVGKNYSNTVVLNEPSVSAQHALLRIRDGFVEVRDLRSSNGTWVGRVKLEEPAALQFRQTIQIGPFDLEFLPPDTKVSELPVCRTLRRGR